jgi:hypothetical protein
VFDFIHAAHNIQKNAPERASNGPEMASNSQFFSEKSARCHPFLRLFKGDSSDEALRRISTGRRHHLPLFPILRQSFINRPTLHGLHFQRKKLENEVF